MAGRVTDSFGISVAEQQSQATQAAGSGEAQGVKQQGIQTDNSAARGIVAGVFDYLGKLGAKAKFQGQVDEFLGQTDAQNQGNWFSRLFTSEAYDQGVQKQQAVVQMAKFQEEAAAASQAAAQQGVSPKAYIDQVRERVQGVVQGIVPGMDSQDAAGVVNEAAQQIHTAGALYVKQYTAVQKRKAEDTADALYNGAVRTAMAVQGDPVQMRAALRQGIDQVMTVPNLDVLSPNYQGKSITQMMDTISKITPVGDANGVRTVNELYREVLDNPQIKKLPASDQSSIIGAAQTMADKSRVEHVAMVTQWLDGLKGSVSRGEYLNLEELTSQVNQSLHLPGMTLAQEGQIARAYDGLMDARAQFYKEQQKATDVLGSITSTGDAEKFVKQVQKLANAAGQDDLSSIATGAVALIQRTATDSNPYTWEVAKQKTGDLLEAIVARSSDNTWSKDSSGNLQIPQPLQQWWQVLKGEWFKAKNNEPNNFYQLTAGKPEYRTALAIAMTDVSASTTNQQILNFNHAVQNMRNTEFVNQAVDPQAAKMVLATTPDESRGMFQRWYDSARASTVNALEFTRWFHAREGSVKQNMQLAQAFLEPENKAAKLEYLRDNFPALNGASPEAARDIVMSGITNNEVNSGVAMTSYASNSTLKAAKGFDQLSPEHRGAIVSMYGNAWEQAHPNDHLTAIRLSWNGDSIAVQGLPASAKNLDGAVHLGLITSDTVKQYNDKFFDTTESLHKSASFGTQVLTAPGSSVVVQADGKNALGIPGGIYTSTVAEAIKVRGSVNPSMGQGDVNRLQQQEIPAMIQSTVFPEARRLGVALTFDKGAPKTLGSLPSDEERRVFSLLVNTTAAAGPQATTKLVNLINKARANPATVDHVQLQKDVTRLFPDNVPTGTIENQILPYVFLAITRKHLQP